MNILCGVTPLAVPLLNKRKLAGRLRITAPFVISEGVEIMSDLSLGGVVSIPAVQTENGLITLTAEHSEIVNKSVNIKTSLSGMENNTETLTVPTSCGIDSFLNVETEMNELLEGSSEISTTIGDCSISGVIEIKNPLQTTGERGSTSVNLPQTTGVVINDSLTVFADGKDVTKHLKKAEIKLFGGNEPLRLAASFSSLVKVPESVQININSEQYTFRVSSFSHSDNALSLSAIRLEDGAKVISETYKRASKICSKNSSIIFAANDFIVRGLEEKMTDFELAKSLAEMSGVSARQMPDGRAMMFCDKKSVSTYKPENILGWEKVSKEPVSSVEIIYGNSGSDYISIEVSEKRPTANFVYVKVYGESTPELQADNGIIELISRGNREEISEDVILINGEGKLSNPAISVATDGVSADGKNIYAASDCYSANITYETVYSEYKLVSERKQNVTLCAYLDSRVVIITGETGENISISVPEICDRTTAHRVAESIIKTKSERSVIRTTHSNTINTASGLKVKTPYCEGFLDSAKITINNNPMKIIDELEVV